MKKIRRHLRKNGKFRKQCKYIGIALVLKYSSHTLIRSSRVNG